MKHLTNVPSAESGSPLTDEKMFGAAAPIINHVKGELKAMSFALAACHSVNECK
eukprot:CAMPEP_0116038436 /NCGR_PEP_ID=MMETSP0321-20121206/22794_1 /TAXON_ID=163516 /ORGANISM="Leptocylindrus danicus var. danicus, Strain B650" /LENGTH=53 /DNA_ID=CAMNT_0003517123 /DNA_START=1 /DNA_END=159 /DNA_ORIENTATION=-